MYLRQSPHQQNQKRRRLPGTIHSTPAPVPQTPKAASAFVNFASFPGKINNTQITTLHPSQSPNRQNGDRTTRKEKGQTQRFALNHCWVYCWSCRDCYYLPCRICEDSNAIESQISRRAEATLATVWQSLVCRMHDIDHWQFAESWNPICGLRSV